MMGKTKKWLALLLTGILLFSGSVVPAAAESAEMPAAPLQALEGNEELAEPEAGVEEESVVPDKMEAEDPETDPEELAEAGPEETKTEEEAETEEESETEEAETEEESETEEKAEAEEESETEEESGEEEETEAEEGSGAEEESGVDEGAETDEEPAEENFPTIHLMSMVLQMGEDCVPGEKFMIYRDGVRGEAPNSDVEAGELSVAAPDLSAENLYFDHAEVDGKRVYEAGTLEELTYYSSISGALSILEAGKTIDLYYVSKYPVNYQYDTSQIEKTAGDALVEKGNALTFRVKPLEKGKNLKVTADGADLSSAGMMFDDTTGERIFTIESVQKALTIQIQAEAVTEYYLTYSSAGIRNGSFMGVSGKNVAPGGTVELEMRSAGEFSKRYVLNMLVINGHEVTTPPSDAHTGASAVSVLPGGETVKVTLLEEDDTLSGRYTNRYQVTVSNVYQDLHISEANFKLEDRNEIIIKEMSGIKNMVGWDEASRAYAEGSVNHVYLQTGGSGNEFYFNLLPGYENPKLTVKVNGEISTANVYFGKNEGNLHDGRPSSFSTDKYQYRFDLPNNLGDNVELFLSAAPISYTVEYRNDRNENELIGTPESGYTVENGNQDIITITSRKPYELEKGWSPDGYVVKGDPSKTKYFSGDVVPVETIAACAQGRTITFLPAWVRTEELGERQITINLYIENPVSGQPILAKQYLLSVGEGKALMKPDEERGKRYLGEFLGDSEEDWTDIYTAADFTLRAGESKARVVEADTQALDFHYDVKKGTLKVKFQWGTNEPGTGTLPEAVTEKFAVRQPYGLDISSAVPSGYTASMKTVSGKMTEEGVEKVVYLYQDGDNDGKPDRYTITLTFKAEDTKNTPSADGTISVNGLTPGGTLSADGKTLVYKLIRAGAEGFPAEEYPDAPQIAVQTEGMGWQGWIKSGETDRSYWYDQYARRPIPDDAADIEFEAGYTLVDNYETVTIHYRTEKEDGSFSTSYTVRRLGEAGKVITYARPHVDGYILPDEGILGSHRVQADGENIVQIDYYLDRDGNQKPDSFTLTLSFRGSGHGSWDANDPLWKRMKDGKDYIYRSGILKIFLIKDNDAGFAVESYPEAPLVKAEETWLFDCWQDGMGNPYGSGAGGDGIEIGVTVGENDVDKNYTAVYDRDRNQDSTPDDMQSVTVIFRNGAHGTVEGQMEFKDLVPGFHSYPEAPEVTAEKGYVFAGWEPDYQKGGTIEANAVRLQEYRAVCKEDRNGNGRPDEQEAAYRLTYDGNAQSGGRVSQIPMDSSSYLTTEKAMLDRETVPVHTEINNTKVLFVGWSAEQTAKIYGKEDAKELSGVVLLTEVTFADKNEIVYAVWSYDTDGDYKPDAAPYTLTVENGSGDGRYAENTEVSVRADDAPQGKVFDCWESSGGGFFAEKTAKETTFTMPGNDVTIRAVYKDAADSGDAGQKDDDDDEDGSDLPGGGTAQAGRTPSAAGQVPATGDDTRLMFWAVLLVLSGIGISAALVLKKKQ